MQKLQCLIVSGFVCLFLQITCSSSARILSVAFVSTKSQKITYQPLLHALAGRGHEVTVLTPIPAGKPVPNVRELLTLDTDKYMNDKEKFPNMFEMKENGSDFNPFKMLDIFGNLCRLTYELPNVQLVLKEKFDLVLVPAIFNECTMGLVHKLNTSVVIIATASAPSWVTGILGTPAPPSFVPNAFSGYGDRMTFYQRLVNLLAVGTLTVVQDYHYKPAMEAIYREKLGDPTLPSSDEIIRNASLILVNSHISLSRPRPFLPDVVEVGGMHCHPAGPLPKDLEDYVNSSGQDGFILFSMGSALKGSDMPEKRRKIILGAFSKLKQKVLWKWETESMPDLPPNVKLNKWLPQQDILGHPKIRAFVTHGGFGSTTESVYHGVPLVGIPMFADQHLNMKKSEASGFAVTLNYNELNEEDLLAAITKVITEPKYKENVMKLSSVFRDQPDKALDRAVFWTEYVLRHKGAVHLRSAARDLGAFQYHSLDVIGFIVSVLAVACYLVLTILRIISRKVFGSTKKQSSNSKKQN